MISYKSHNDALKKLNIESLEDRRKSLCLKFAKKCLQVENLKKLFLNNLKSHTMLKRGSDKFKVNRSLTTRYSPNAENAKERLMRVDIKPYQPETRGIFFRGLNHLRERRSYCLIPQF